MKTVMLSIRPEWVELIIGGKKTVEVRKTRPKIETPFRCYIYCTVGTPTVNIPISDSRLRADVLKNGMKCMNCPIGNGKVIGECMCDDIHAYPQGTFPTDFSLSDMRMKGSQFHKYRGTGTAYGWHISELVIYDKPKELREFSRVKIMRSNGGRLQEFRNRLQAAPQSWCYVEELGA